MVSGSEQSFDLYLPLNRQSKERFNTSPLYELCAYEELYGAANAKEIYIEDYHQMVHTIVLFEK